MLCLSLLSLQQDAAATQATPQTSTDSQRPQQWAQAVDTSANLFKVNDQFYRSAQIQSELLPTLQSLGIKTVVSLRAFHSDEQILKNSGIRMQRIGINTWDINDNNVILALRTLRNAQQQGPVLLHCQHGADRTGLITAMYRILYQSWTKEQALEELTQGGYGYHSMWKNIPDYLRRADIEKIRQGVNLP
ncbi:dual specificity protein phosphatase family protein [Undibacterium sp. CY7W]|uniref:Dual specificity protein phosphatase family protein n=2 Tax=Undibacterium rugosum TaxID=2762291 RepID=A0A923I0Z5_9BURK|nr:dual specificity protein phosphatase family protein [Undibacterium rugosum]